MADGSSWMGGAIAVGALAVAGLFAIATRGAPPSPVRPLDPTAVVTNTPPPDPPGPPPAVPTGPPGQITFEADSHDFGALLQGDTPSYVFRFSNTGAGPLRILRVHPQCGCNAVQRVSSSVAPGATGEIQVSLDTRALLGRTGKVVDVYTDDPAQRVVRLTLWSDVRRAFSLTPEAFVFGEIPPGTAVVRTVTLRRTDDSPFEILDHSTAPEGFTLRLLPPDPADPNARTLELTCTAQWSAASADGRVFVQTDPATPAPLYIHYSAQRQQPIVVEPWQARFGRVGPGERPAQAVRLRATDGGAFQVVRCEVAPADLVTVDVQGQGAAWTVTLRPGPRWPAAGAVNGRIQITTDRFPMPIVVLIEGVQLR